MKKRNKISKKKNLFPFFEVLILILGIFWFLNDLSLITIRIPWLALTVIILSIKKIIKK